MGLEKPSPPGDVCDPAGTASLLTSAILLCTQNTDGGKGAPWAKQGKGMGYELPVLPSYILAAIWRAGEARKEKSTHRDMKQQYQSSLIGAGYASQLTQQERVTPVVGGTWVRKSETLTANTANHNVR